MLNRENQVKQLVILSGKGGTGKTSLTAALAHLASQSATRCVFVDADVDAANLGLVTKAKKLKKQAFISSKLAHIDADLCNNCNKCFEVCRYDAIELPSNKKDSYKINDLLCDGCASCVYICPQSAIEMVEQQDGEWYFSTSPFGPLFHAELFPGAENTGKLVTLIKQHAKLFAEDHDEYPLVIIDGPPGIGCPVISSSAGADLALLVAEPGLSGMHDLARIVETLKHFKIPLIICINKANLYAKGVEEIKQFAASKKIQIIGNIPFDNNIPKAMVQAQPITEFSPESGSSKAIKSIWEKVQIILFFEEEKI
jgi:MinD superfamily P-loop ATPase